MTRKTTTQPRKRTTQTPAKRRRSGDPIDPMPRIIERKQVTDSARSTQRTGKGKSTLARKRTTVTASTRNARQVGRAIGTVLGKVIGSVEQTVAKVMPGRTRRAGSRR